MSCLRRAHRYASFGSLLLGSILFAGCSGAGGTSMVGAIPSGAAVQAAAVQPGSDEAAAAVTQPLAVRQSAGIKTVSAVQGASYDATILADNALDYYRMNDTTMTLNDAQTNGRPGTLGSAVALGAVGLTSMSYSAALFPGGDIDPTRIAQVLPNTKLQPTVVSVEAWVTPSALNTTNRYQPIVAYGNYSTGTSYQLTITPINQFFFSIHNATSSPSVVAKTTSSPGHVYHLIGTYDGASLKLYVNGVLEGQGSATGAIDYTRLTPTTGLAIGGGLNALSNHPLTSYAGTIADVSIYGSALTAAQASNHYLTGVKTPPLTETPVSSDKFVDSIGVNAPFNYQSTVYDTKYAVLKPLLIASGIRHIRAGLAHTTWTTYFNRLNELGAAGIHSQLVTMGTETAADLQAYPAKVSQSMEAYEGPNEPDLAGDPNWIAKTSAFMKMLYPAVKGNAPTANLAVIGPSVVTPAGEAAIGNLGAYMDYGNFHPYYGTNNPGNSGTGSIGQFGRSGSLQSFMGVAGQVSGTKPLIASETGFGTNATIAGNVSELCDGKEAPRTYLEHFKNGVARTLPYQLVQSGAAYGALGFFSYMGFLRQDLTPKPSYNAIKGITTLLSDKGAALTTTPLTYTIRGNINNLEHLLMQKRNGTYYLALWLEVPSWNTTTNSDLTAPPQSVTIGMPSTVTSASLSSIDDLGNMTSAAVTPTSGSVTIPVADRVTILAFHP